MRVEYYRITRSISRNHRANQQDYHCQHHQAPLAEPKGRPVIDAVWENDGEGLFTKAPEAAQELV